jgi:phosphohistidine phosphatase SixA
MIALTAPGWATAAELPREALIDAMKDGGVVLYIRHTQTESDYADQIDATLGDCSTQRVLSEAGWSDARRIGKALQDLDLDIVEVISSEYCRAWQTADLAFGAYTKNAALNFEPAETYTDAQFSDMRDRVTPLLSAPTHGVRVIVGHDDPFEAATGIYPEPQGVAFLIRPDGTGDFEVLGQIKPNEWTAH